MHKLPQAVYEKKQMTLREWLGDDWGMYEGNQPALEAWVSLIKDAAMVKKGIAPDNYTATTECAGCGVVPVPPEQANGGHVLGCMWCQNRYYNRPMPKIIKYNS
jgi:hypothetical protein